jgi:vitamin B12/bleomycin/antimicrobial peptide transport system ATP-binding/permease protein
MTPKHQRNARSQSENGRDLDEVIVDLDADSETSKKVRGRLVLRRFWQSATGFWRGIGSRRSWLLMGAIVLTIVLNLAVSYGMNIWNRAIFDALEKHGSGTVLSLALIYFPFLAASVCLMATQIYFRMTTQRQWRRWLTHHLLDRWLRNGRHYQLKFVTGD